MFILEHFDFVALDKKAQLNVCTKGSPEAKLRNLGLVWVLSSPESKRADPQAALPGSMKVHHVI